ncbi:MAG: tetratricopeptide repeat protein [Vicingaceae bacterium]|nr:tetratricopeptide repeat protein [Vicingaceae bacterium]
MSATLSSAQSSFNQGVIFFDKRAEKHEGLKVDSTNINLAISHFKDALKSKENNEEATDYLLLCYYYKAAFVVRTKDEQKKNYFIGQTLGKAAIKKYPKNKGILLWYIANMSKYGEAKGIVSSAKNGLADKIKKHTEKLMELDPKFSDGAPYRIMGVINYKVPYIPLFLTWPSKKKAEEYLKKALIINSKNISNLYYYAEFLVEEKRETEAKVLLKKILKTSPRKTALIEDMYDLSMSKKLLSSIK